MFASIYYPYLAVTDFFRTEGVVIVLALISLDKFII